MKTFKRITIGLAALALTATGCSKSSSGDTPSQNAEQTTMAKSATSDQPGLAKETVLVMGFHHDS